MVNNYIKYCIYLIAGILFACLEGCVNDDIPKIDSEEDFSSYKFEEFEFPGYLALYVGNSDSSRSDEMEDTGEDDKNKVKPSVGDSFVEATPDEYALAPSLSDSEAHHYMLLFEDKSLQMVIPLKTQELKHVNSHGSEPDLNSGMYLYVKKAFVSTYFAEGKSGLSKEYLSDINNFKNFLKGLEAYVVLNFDKSLISDKSAVNYPSTLALLEGIKKLDDLLKIQYSGYKIKVKNSEGVLTDYFTMSSTMYVDGIEGNYTIKPASEIDESKIYYTEDFALGYQPAISAWVERLAVKYKLNVNSEYSSGKNTVKVFRSITTNGDYEMVTDNYAWKAFVLGYAVNALEPTEYLFKNIGVYTDNKYSWANQSSIQRYHWAYDPHHTISDKANELKAGYPHQFREAIETDSIRRYIDNPDDIKDNEKGGVAYLKYISFNDIKSKPELFYSTENTFEDLEGFSQNDNDLNNTFFANGVGPYNYFTASTHFLLACKLQLGENTSERDIYRDEDDIFYGSREHLLTAKLTLLNDRDLVGGSADIRVLNVDWYNTGGEHSDDLRIMTWPKGARLYYQPKNGSEREVTINDLDVFDAYLTGGDGKVFIGPKNNLEGTFYLWVNDNNKVVVSKNQIASLFHKFNGTVNKFTGGRMYYCAPITHRVASKNKDSWKTTGHIGVVRNNWYEVTVTGLNAPGHSVAEPDDLIIPMLDPDRDYLSARVRVLRWHEVSSNVTPIPGE